MPRDEIPFDPGHPRCKFPEFGALFSSVLEETGQRCNDVAASIKVSTEIVRGYRRGFARPSPFTMTKLEKHFGRPLVPRADGKPDEVTMPSTLTVRRHASGDFILTFRVAPEQIGRFLKG